MFASQIRTHGPRPHGWKSTETSTSLDRFLAGAPDQIHLVEWDHAHRKTAWGASIRARRRGAVHSQAIGAPVYLSSGPRSNNPAPCHPTTGINGGCASILSRHERVMIRVDWPIITTDWTPALWLAWGPRVLSSSARAAGVKRYGGRTTAHWKMWLSWISDRPRRMRRGPAVVIVSDKEGHGARYAKELVAREVEEAAERRKADMLSRIDDLQRQRREARARRDFDLADKLRDEIEAAGIQVNDMKLRP